MTKFIYLLTLVFVLAACGTGEVPNSGTKEKLDEPLLPTLAEAQEGDFFYRLVTEKDVYDEFGDLEIFAELTYVGELESIDIYHAASPFFFPLEEKTRGIEIDYAMNQPLIITTLQKGKPLRQEFAFAGGYSDNDPVEYVKFIKTIINDGFPEGEYIIHGSTEFTTAEPPVVEQKDNHLLKADIGFTVTKNIN